MKVSQQVSRKSVQRTIYVQNGFEFVTEGGSTFGGVFTLEVNGTWVSELCVSSG
jgi:hypothetical protein